jgi:serine/threonine protein kinase
LESVVQRLEEAWHAGTAPELGELLAPVPAAERRQVAIECIKVDMEFRWRHGQPIHIERYLRQFSELSDDETVVAQLLASECYSRVLYDAPPTANELASRFPAPARALDVDAITREALIDRADMKLDQETDPGQPPHETASDPVSDPPLILLGEQLGRYQILGKIGTGGQGDVYHAVDTHLGREVALKLLRNSDSDLLKRFAREGALAAAVEHRNICRVYDAGTIRGMHYIAMALVTGQTVQQRLDEDGPMDQTHAASLVKAIAGALVTVHAAGIIHRDIKSGNIMIDQQGVPLLMDFGLARSASHSEGMTTTGDFGGTLAFMSPEQAGGYPPDQRSDIYSLGVVLYQMLTGAVPFGLLPAEFFKQIGKSPPPSPLKMRPELDRDLATICRVAMATRAEDRYPSAEAMVDALERYLEGRPQVVTPRRSRRPWAIGLAIGAIVLLAFGAAFYRHATSRPDTELDTVRGPRHVDRWIETGFSVMSFVVDRNAERLFVADSLGKKSYPIREFDVVSGREVGEPIPFDDLHIHNGMVLSSDERYLFATNFYFDYISRIDLAGSREPESIRIIGDHKETSDAWRWANGIVLNPDGTQAIVPMGHDGRPDSPDGFRNDQLAIIDLTLEPPKLLVEVPLEDEPWGVGRDIPPDESAVYLTTMPRPMTDLPKVHRVELHPPYAHSTFAVPDGRPIDVAVSVRLDRIYIADEAHRGIWVVERSSFGQAMPDKFFSIEQRAPHAVALNDDRNLLAVLCANARSLHLLDAVTGTELARYELLRRGCDRLAFSADGRKLFASSNSMEGGVAVIDVPEFTARIAFSSDRAGANDQIYTMMEDGTDVKPLFASPSHAQDYHPRWSPDGRRIAFLTNRRPTWKLAVARADGTQLRLFEDTTPRASAGPAWSPSGTTLAYVNIDQLAIHLVDLESGSVTAAPCELGMPPNEVASVAWESDETLIVEFQPIRNALKREIYRLNVTTGDVMALTDEQDLESSCLWPAVSRGGRILVHRDLVRDGPADGIFLLHENMPRDLMFEKITQDGPPVSVIQDGRWFPHGNEVVFTARPENGQFWQLYRLDLGTKSYRALPSGDWNDLYPDVSPPLPDAWLR